MTTTTIAPSSAAAPSAHPPASSRRSLRHRLALVALPLLALLGACGSSSGDTSTSPPGRPTPDAGALTGAAEDPHLTLVARPSADTEVYDAPGAADPAQVLPARNAFGSSLALVVEEAVDGWLRVQLPTRPNGSTGWIRSDGVELRPVELAVHVDLGARTLTVTDAGEVLLEAPVAVGAEATPTPTGTFFVVDKLQSSDPAGAYGPFAFGLSAHSDVLTEFAGGQGQVGIHGTNVPGSIGTAGSNGCIRVPNDVAEALDQVLPLGTPVTIA